MKTKKFTILHSNDMHGDFLAEIREGKGKMIGGLSLLSGYINKVREEEENVLYVISGDMLQGSLIDAEWKGISTIEIMNWLSPDVVAIGNHEVDYGLSHLLFLEKLANFPIVNANLYIKSNYKRLLTPYLIIKRAGFDILFTGIITEKIMDSIKQDKLIGSFVNLSDASEEVGRICNVYKKDDIDLTILLTHIGFESDIKLAGMLDPKWGVDMIIGGHSHTVLDKPERVNNILIAQAGVGTDQIGRFDIEVDDDTNSIVRFSWKLIPILEGIAPKDEKLEKFIKNYKKQVDRKYSAIVTRFQDKLTHPVREVETTLGNLVADAFAQRAECSVMLVGSGSIRVKELGPVVTLKDLLSCFPYDDSLVRFKVKGIVLKKIFSYIMRIQNRDGEGECYQVNSGVSAVYSEKEKKLKKLLVNGKKIKDQETYFLCMQNYHFSSCKEYLGVSKEELLNLACDKIITTSAKQVLEEWLRNHQNEKRIIEGRLIYE